MRHGGGARSKNCSTSARRARCPSRRGPSARACSRPRTAGSWPAPSRCCPGRRWTRRCRRAAPGWTCGSAPRWRPAMSSRRSDGEISSRRTGLSVAWLRTSSGISDSVALMRCRRSASTASASRKMLDSAWPPICAIDGYGAAPSCAARLARACGPRRSPGCGRRRGGWPARSAPSGASSRRRTTRTRPAGTACTAGNMNGIAADASRCAIVSSPCTATRLERIHGWCSASDW